MSALITQDQIAKDKRLHQLAAAGRAFAKRNAHPALKYAKGEYSADKKEIPLGTQVIALAGHARAEWRNFKTGHSYAAPMEEIRKLPKRKAPGDNDPDKWEVGADGEPRDPWVFQLAVDVLLKEKTYTFASSSYGGRTAIGALVEDYASSPEAADGKLPLVALESDSYSYRDYGKVKVPVLRIVDWSDASKLPALPRIGPKPGRESLKPAADIIDDDTPF